MSLGLSGTHCLPSSSPVAKAGLPTTPPLSCQDDSIRDGTTSHRSCRLWIWDLPRHFFYVVLLLSLTFHPSFLVSFASFCLANGLSMTPPLDGTWRVPPHPIVHLHLFALPYPGSETASLFARTRGRIRHGHTRTWKPHIARAAPP